MYCKYFRFATYKNNLDIPNEQKNIISKYFLNKKKNIYKSIYDNIISDEGGRFYHCEVRNIAIMLEEHQGNKFQIITFGSLKIK